MDTALTGKSIPETPGSEKRRLVRASAGKGEKAPLSSGAEMLRRPPAVIGKEVRSSQLRIQVEPRTAGTTGPAEPGTKTILVLPEMRCSPLKYTKYSCGGLRLFPTKNFSFFARLR